MDGIAIGAAIPGEAATDGAMLPEPCAKAHNGVSTRMSAPANEIRGFIANSPFFAIAPFQADFARLPLNG
jgi:hypothetical protein